MANNFFLTGEKGIGKSTIINEVIDSFNGKIGGFKTVRKYNNDGRISFHFLNVAKNEIPNEENLLFYRCENKNEEEIKNKFNIFSSALDDLNDFDIIIMDEIGPNEEKANIFKEKIIEVLDSDKYVLGVLQKTNSNFLDSIKNRIDIKVYTVTKENRQEIKKEIIKVILGIFDNEKN